MKRRHFKIVIANVLSLLVLFFWAEFSFARHTQDKPDTKSISATKHRKFTLDLEISAGYRIDRLDWTIAGGNPKFVNILSELSWDDLRIHQYKMGGRLTIPLDRRPYTVYVRGAASYGKIVEGENQDSDYGGDNRTLEFSRSNNDADDGDVLDGTIGAGFQLKRKLRRSKWTLGFTPLIGYSYHQQNLKMTNAFQTIPLTGAFSGLNSSYDTEWFGPWFGLDLAMDDGNKNTFLSSFEYHWDTTYYAEANWNLRTDFAHPVSFTHEADGRGIVATIGWDYLIRRKVSINTTLEYQRWTTEGGVDTTFLSNGTADTTPLNQVNWESRSFSLGLQYRFQ